MKEYRLKTVVPTESDAGGLHYDGSLYFPVGTHLLKYSKNRYSRISGVEGTILDFSVGERLFIITEDRMYMNNESTIIRSLKGRFSCITTSSSLIALGSSNVLEIWHIPTEFKFTMFKQHSRNFGHFMEITSIEFINENLLVTTSKDCTVRVFDILSNTSRRVCNTIGIPVSAHVISSTNMEIAVVCEDGAVLYYTLEDEDVVPNGKIYTGSKVLASGHYLDFTAISLDKDDENLVVYKGPEKVYSASISYKIIGISMFGESIAVRGNGFVGVYDLMANSFVFELDLPKIVSMDVHKELVVAGCSDKKVRVYDEHRCIQVFSDPNVTHAVFSVHILRNSVVCVYINGRVSVWDLKNGVCYRSFEISLRVSASEVSSDGLLLFLADFNHYTIRVVDLQRSKEVDTLTGHAGPIFRMRWNQDSLYSVSYDNSIRKWNVCFQSMALLQLEKMVTGFSVRSNKICIATTNEITIYDNNFNYERSVKVALKARKKNEAFVSEKPVEHADFTFDNKFVIIGGESNTIKVISADTGDVVQSLQASDNREWENYKEKLGKESNRSFDKTKIIEVLKILHSDSQKIFYVLTREGVGIYESSITRFAPINLDISLTPEAIRQYLNDGEYLKATIGSLKINQYEVIKNAILSCPSDSTEAVVRYLDEYLVENLRSAISRMLDDSRHHLTAIEWLKFIVFHFGSSKREGSEVHKLKRNISSVLQLGKLNRSMLSNIIKR